MENLRFLLWGLALATLTACVDLDEQLVGTVTTTYFSTPAGLEAAVDGDYAQLRDFFGREESFAVTEFGTDLTSNGDQGAYQFENTYAAGLNASDGHYQFPWTSFYRGINTSNTVVARAPAVTGMDPAVKASRIAEAKFLRALSYFWLVQMYGPVPLPLTESQGASNQAHRSPVDSVYLRIVQDLREAIPDLPATQIQFGRATKRAAQHLLAKVLLTRAYHPRRRQLPVRANALGLRRPPGHDPRLQQRSRLPPRPADTVRPQPVATLDRLDLLDGARHAVRRHVPERVVRQREQHGGVLCIAGRRPDERLPRRHLRLGRPADVWGCLERHRDCAELHQRPA